MQRIETVFRKLSSKGHKLTVTPDRITVKVATDTPEEEITLLDDFQRKLAAEEIEVGNSFRGDLELDNVCITACLLNSSRKEKLRIRYLGGKIDYSFEDVVKKDKTNSDK